LFDAAAQVGNRADAERHPEVIAARKNAENKISPLKAEAVSLDEMITALQAILRIPDIVAFLGIMAEGATIRQIFFRNQSVKTIRAR
jgi:hypothetical protein